MQSKQTIYYSLPLLCTPMELILTIQMPVPLTGLVDFGVFESFMSTGGYNN